MGTHFPLINFMSRERSAPEKKSESLAYHPLIASHQNTLQLPHSEPLLLHSITNCEETIALKLLSQHSQRKIRHLGILLYSSLDSCDECEERLYRFFAPSSPFYKKITNALHAAHVPWMIGYFSSSPCKKSSYILSLPHSERPFSYDKLQRKFFFSKVPQEELSFSSSKEAIDLSAAHTITAIVSSIQIEASADS